MKPFSFVALSVAVFAALTVTSTIAGRTPPAVAATPPPTPPPIAPQEPLPNTSTMAPAAPAPTGTLAPSPSPPPNARKGLDGVWEVQIQHPSGTDYTHFKIAQQGGALSGTYLDARGKRYPISGSVDGQAVRLIVAMPDGTTLLLEGKLDGTTDMIGMLTSAGGEVPFTASYRAKEKWIDNVNPSPGGISQPGGGYTPP
ncbi:MAG: hypothetical protein JO190_00430 [Candidatus Eremiobacteraeota bacterium]|nr:hypothetical protein [Candidatus Eremiobacteraeota bacterium]MBV8499881.1 hypothetical protein [Candidatus Eremiobacteraeota bacterium]